TLAGTSVEVNGIAAPLIYASPRQINFQVPWEGTGQPQISIAAVRSNMTSAAQTFSSAQFGPGIFTLSAPNKSQGAIIVSSTGDLAASSGSIPGRAARPAQHGETISIFCSGLGTVDNQ